MSVPCPRRARHPRLSPAAVSRASPRFVGTSGSNPKHPEPSGPSSPKLESLPEDALKEQQKVIIANELTEACFRCMPTMFLAGGVCVVHLVSNSSDSGEAWCDVSKIKMFLYAKGFFTTESLHHGLNKHLNSDLCLLNSFFFFLKKPQHLHHVCDLSLDMSITSTPSPSG